jgi:hypothetical protein
MLPPKSRIRILSATASNNHPRRASTLALSLQPSAFLKSLTGELTSPNVLAGFQDTS